MSSSPSPSTGEGGREDEEEGGRERPASYLRKWKHEGQSLRLLDALLEVREGGREGGKEG